MNIDQIIRSKRRTLSLEIARDARLIIRAPVRMPLGEIERLVLRKKSWIEKNQKKFRTKHQEIIPKKYIAGEQFLYLGHLYPLSIVDEGSAPLMFTHEFCLLKKFQPVAKQLFMDWYKKEACRTIKDRLDWYCLQSGLQYNQFNVTGASKRWGSCNLKNNLNFSWRLIMSPLSVIDYVVAHELAHIEEKNHSQRFWKKVQAIFPDYKSQNRWLRENGHWITI